MLDILQIIFWSITYILVIISGFRSRSIKRVAMPYLAGILNFSWELCALYSSHGFWGHVLWLGLDLVIVYFGFRFLVSLKGKIVYAILLVIMTMVLMRVFNQSQGMLFSVFAIDLIMAICYIAKIQQLSPELKIPIAVTKLIGDAFAGIYYAKQSIFVAIVAVVVFCCNLFYLSACLEETSRSAKKARKK